jgi:hypothetical protein
MSQEYYMSNKARDLLASFDALPDLDKQLVVVEILRRTPEGNLPISTLESLADELFAKLDQEETQSPKG